MSKRATIVEQPTDVESLYHLLLRELYEKEDRENARVVAERLDLALATAPEYRGSIRGEEICSLLAEARENYYEAIRCREAEIRKILQLHSLSEHTPSWEYVRRQYGFDDVSDRLDILATLYDKQGDVERAVKVLLESKAYCASRKIPFDGQDLLDELEQVRAIPTSKRPPTPRRDEALDPAIRDAYKGFGRSADSLMIDDTLFKQLLERVRHRLPAGAKVTARDVKRRLLALRRRGEARGGLPRIGREAAYTQQ